MKAYKQTHMQIFLIVSTQNSKDTNIPKFKDANIQECRKLYMFAYKHISMYMQASKNGSMFICKNKEIKFCVQEYDTVEERVNGDPSFYTIRETVLITIHKEKSPKHLYKYKHSERFPPD